MARRSQTEFGTPLSILERLTDLDPATAQETSAAPWEEARILRSALCRDLTSLLNTRRAEEDFDPAFEQASRSVLNYGVIDFTYYNLKSSLDQERIRRSIEKAIRQYEPRLSQVVVTVNEPDLLNPVLAFEVSG